MVNEYSLTYLFKNNFLQNNNSEHDYIEQFRLEMAALLCCKWQTHLNIDMWPMCFFFSLGRDSKERFTQRKQLGQTRHL